MDKKILLLSLLVLPLIPNSYALSCVNDPNFPIIIINDNQDFDGDGIPDSFGDCYRITSLNECISRGEDPSWCNSFSYEEQTYDIGEFFGMSDEPLPTPDPQLNCLDPTVRNTYPILCDPDYEFEFESKTVRTLDTSTIFYLLVGVILFLVVIFGVVTLKK